MRSYEYHQKQREMLAGKRIVGIDPGKEKHQASVVEGEGAQRGRSFSFPVSHEGYDKALWKRLDGILGAYGPDDLVFAVETACGVWRTIAEYLSRRGYTVVLASPLTTYHSRSVMNNDYSKTDPKDALLVAINARSGNYIPYRQYTPEINRLHRLGIAYSKLAKDRQKAVSRLRAAMEEVFPEYLGCVSVDATAGFPWTHFDGFGGPTPELREFRYVVVGNPVTRPR